MINIASGSYYTFSSFTTIVATGGYVESNANPSLIAFNGKLWLAFNAAGPSGTNYGNIISYDGSSWGSVTGLPAGEVDYSPSLASDGTYLYVGLRDKASHTLTICKTDGVNPFTCTNFPSSQTMNFNPGLTVFNGVLYIGFETSANSHSLYYYTSTDQGNTISPLNTSLSAQSSSCAPHLAVHNGVLWFDFRTNDSDHKFAQRFSTDGVTWQHGADAHIAMGGEPMVVDGEGMVQNYQYIYLFYSSNDSYQNLYITSAQ